MVVAVAGARVISAATFVFLDAGRRSPSGSLSLEEPELELPEELELELRLLIGVNLSI